MKRLLFVVLTGALLGGALVGNAYADGKGRGHQKHAVAHADSRHDRDHRHYAVGPRVDYRYVGAHDVVVVRDYYRPYYRPVPRGVRHVYVRNGYLPYGWERQIVAVPVYVQHRMAPLPYGYSRGVIDGHLVVHNNYGLVVDVAVLF